MINNVTVYALMKSRFKVLCHCLTLLGSVASVTNNTTLLFRLHITVAFAHFLYQDLFHQDSVAMAVQLRPDKSNLLRAGSYKFQMEDVEVIYKLYTIDKWTLWTIKEWIFENATIQQLAVAVMHGGMNIEKIPYFDRATFTYSPDNIVLAEFNVGHPTEPANV